MSQESPINKDGDTPFLDNLEDNLNALMLFLNSYASSHDLASVTSTEDLPTCEPIYHILRCSPDPQTFPPDLTPLKPGSSANERTSYLTALIATTLASYTTATSITLPEEEVPTPSRLLLPSIVLEDVKSLCGLVLSVGILGEKKDDILASIFELSDEEQHYVMLSVAPFLPQVIEEEEEMNEDIQLAELSFAAPAHTDNTTSTTEQTLLDNSIHTTRAKESTSPTNDSLSVVTPIHKRKKSIFSPFSTLVTPAPSSMQQNTSPTLASTHLTPPYSLMRRNSYGSGLLSPKTLLNSSYTGKSPLTSSPRNLSMFGAADTRQSPRARKMSFFTSPGAIPGLEELQRDYESLLVDRHRCEQESEQLQVQLEAMKKAHEKQLYEWSVERETLLRQYQEQLQELQTQANAHYIEEQAQVRIEYEEARSQLERQVRELKQSLASQHEYYAMQVAEYERVLGESHRETERLRDVINTYSEKSRSINALETQLNKFLAVGLGADEIKGRLEEVEMELSIAREENRHLRAQYESVGEAEERQREAEEERAIHELERRLHEISIKHEYSERTAKSLQEQLEDLRGERQLLLDKTDTLSHKLEVTGATLREKIMKIEQEKLKVEQERNVLAVECDTIRKEREEEEKLKEEEEKVKEALITSLRGEVESMRAMKDDVDREIVLLRAQVEEVDVLKTHLAELEELRVQVAAAEEWREKSRALEVKYTELMVKHDDMEIEFESYKRAMEHDLAALREELEVERGKCVVLIQERESIGNARELAEKERETLRAACESKDVYVSELEGLLKAEEEDKERQVLELQQQKDELYGLISSKDIELEYQADLISLRDTALNAKIKECTALEEKIQDKEQDAVLLREKLETSQDLIASLQEEAREKGEESTKIAELSIQVAEAKAELGVLRGKLDLEVKGKADTVRRCAELEREALEMKEMMNKHEQQVTDLQNRVISAQDEVITVKDTTQRQEEEIQSLHSELSARDEEVASLRQALEDLQKSTSKNSVVSSEATLELESLRASNTSLEAELVSLRTTLEQEVKLKNKFEKYVVQVSRNIRDVEEKASRATQQNSKLLEALKQVRLERDQLETELYERERVLKEYSLVVKREQKLMATAFYEMGSEFHRYLADQRLRARLSGADGADVGSANTSMGNVSEAYQSWVNKQRASLQRDYM